MHDDPEGEEELAEEQAPRALAVIGGDRDAGDDADHVDDDDRGGRHKQKCTSSNRVTFCSSYPQNAIISETATVTAFPLSSAQAFPSDKLDAQDTDDSDCEVFRVKRRSGIVLEKRCSEDVTTNSTENQINADGVTKKFHHGEKLQQWHEEIELQNSLLDVLAAGNLIRWFSEFDDVQSHAFPCGLSTVSDLFYVSIWR